MLFFHGATNTGYVATAFTMGSLTLLLTDGFIEARAPGGGALYGGMFPNTAFVPAEGAGFISIDCCMVMYNMQLLYSACGYVVPTVNN